MAVKPKVGDKAIIDGVELAVLEVGPRGKAKVVMGDADAAALAERVKKVRSAHAKAQADLDKKFQAAMAEPDKRARRVATRPLKAEQEALHEKVSAELAEIPRGVRIGAALKDLEFVEAAGAWSVPGRLLSYADRKKRGRTS